MERDELGLIYSTEWRSTVVLYASLTLAYKRSRALSHFIEQSANFWNVDIVLKQGMVKIPELKNEIVSIFCLQSRDNIVYGSTSQAFSAGSHININGAHQSKFPREIVWS